MKTYLFIFDRRSDYDYTKLHESIDKDTDIFTWSHYLKSSYILISKLSASELTDNIRRYFSDHQFLISEIDIYNYNGWLPEEAWKWIRENKKRI